MKKLMIMLVGILMIGMVSCKKSSKCVAYQSQYDYAIASQQDPVYQENAKNPKFVESQEQYLDDLKKGAKKHMCGSLD